MIILCQYYDLYVHTMIPMDKLSFLSAYYDLYVHNMIPLGLLYMSPPFTPHPPMSVKMYLSIDRQITFGVYDIGIIILFFPFSR